MRVAVRFLLAVLSLALICGAMGALSGSGADSPGRGAAFYQPHHAPPDIEAAPVSAAPSFTDEWIAAPVTGAARQVGSGTRVAARPASPAAAPALESALYQRPPPRTRLA